MLFCTTVFLPARNSVQICLQQLCLFPITPAANAQSIDTYSFNLLNLDEKIIKETSKCSLQMIINHYHVLQMNVAQDRNIHRMNCALKIKKNVHHMKACSRPVYL